MTLNNITAISPIDGRYHSKTEALSPYFSEYGLHKARLLVEVEWFILLSQTPEVIEVPLFSAGSILFLRELVKNFTPDEAVRVQEIEKTTNHDVKAIEYYLKEKIKNHPELQAVSEFIHFSCTSEDINNVSYAIILQQNREQSLLPTLDIIQNTLRNMAHQYADTPLLSRTHGQPATPTTVGKEFANVVARLERQIAILENMTFLAKFNGAVGNYNAHHIAYPDIDWPALSKHFVESFKIQWSAYTTQIEPHDYMAELFDTLARINRILIDLCRDVWGYISYGYFTQKSIAGETGSSTMPHKVNPIDFENAEGNFGLSNALLHHFSEKLPISRMQRDLSDSTVLRNIGCAFSYQLIAFGSLIKGLSKLELNTIAIQHDLSQNWEVLSEAIQTIMRRYSIEKPYEKLKNLTRGKKITPESLTIFINTLDLPIEAKNRLLQLTPETYIGYADELSRRV